MDHRIAGLVVLMLAAGGAFAAGNVNPPHVPLELTGNTYQVKHPLIGAGGAADMRGPCRALRGNSGQAIAGYLQGSVYTLSAGYWNERLVANASDLFNHGFEECLS